MEDENFVSFGEEGALLTYGSYLRLPQLLDAQHLESDPPAHDELLFITIHQVYELWFQQLLHEVEAVRDALLETADRAATDGDRLWWARHLLNRVHVIERVLVQQVDVLETMTPQDFLEFRQRLAPASGFQSVQFRELEFLSGAKDAGFLRRFQGLTDAEKVQPAPAAGRAVAVGRRSPRVLGLEAGSTSDADEALTASLRRVAHDRASLRRPLGAGRGADPARRARGCLACPARRDGRADDRLEDGHRRLHGCGLPAQPAGAEVLPAALGPALGPVTESG